MFKRLLAEITLVAAILLLPLTAFAAPVSWDFAAGILQPLQSGWSALVKADRFQATGTIPSIFPDASTTNLSATTLCLSLDCRTVWPTSGSPGGSSGQVQYNASGAFGGVATGTISNGTGISVTAGQSVIGSGLTITNTGVTSNIAGTGISVSGATGAVTITNTGATSVSNSDGTLTISPTTGAVVASIALAHANTWTGQQTFNTSAPIFGTITGSTQCLHVNTAGLLSGTGSDCGSGSATFAYPFTPSTDGGVPTSATSTALEDTHPGLGIDVANTSWYGIGGLTFAYASTTTHGTLVGLGAGGNNATTSATVSENTSFGFNAMGSIGVGFQNTAIGSRSMDTITQGSYNTSVGFATLSGGTLLGSDNIAFGAGAMGGTGVTGNKNVIISTHETLTNFANLTGSANILIGAYANLPSLSTSGQLNIGNVLYGTGLYNSASNSSAPTSLGHLSIGTTTPFVPFELASTSASTGMFGQLALTDNNAGANLKHWLFSSEGGNFYLGTTSDLYASSTIAALTINANGFLGVGTTSPAKQLSVNGVIYSGSGGFQFPDGTIQTTAAAGSTNYFTNSGASTYLSTGTNLGIGTTTPFSTLSVSTTGQQSGLLSLFTIASTTNTELFRVNGNGSVVAASGALNITTTGGIQTTSGITAGGGAPTPAIGQISVYGSGTQLGALVGSAASAGGLNLPSLAHVSWASTANSQGTLDTGLSRVAANVLSVDTGTVGNTAGTLVAANIGVGTTSPFGILTVSDNTANPNTTAFLISSSTASATTTLLNVANTGQTTFVAGSGARTSITFAGIGNNYGFYEADASHIALADSNTTAAQVAFGASSGISLGNTNGIYFSNSGSAIGTIDIGIRRIAVNTLATINTSTNGAVGLPSGTFLTGVFGAGATSTPGGIAGIAGQAGGTINLLTVSSSTSGFATSTALVVSNLGNLHMLNGTGIDVGYGIAPPTNGLIASGKVGIGTSSPTGQLSVVNSDDSVPALLVRTNSTVPSACPLRLETNTGATMLSDCYLSTIGSNSLSLFVSGNAAFGGTAVVPNAIIQVAANLNDPTTASYGVSISRTLVLTATNSNAVTGGSFQVSTNGSNFNQTGVIAGGLFTIQNSNIATLTDGRGGDFLFYNTGAGTVTKAYGGHFTIQNLVSGGAITNAYGVYVGGGFNNGTITNLYGSYIDTLVSATSTWGYYENSTAPNYFAGKLGIGTTSPFVGLDLASTSASANSNIGFGQLALTDTNAGTNLKHWLATSEGGNYYLGTTTDKFATTTTAVLTINQNGFFGIGTSSPAKQLSVNGIIYSGVGGFMFPDGTIQTTAAAGSANFFTNSGAATWLTTGSLLGVGTTSPWATLSVGTTTASIGNFPAFAIGSSTNASLFSVFYNGNVGIGTSTPFASFSLAAASSTDPNKPVAIFGGFENTTFKAFETIDQWGHHNYSGAQPTLSACGTSPSFYSASNDVTGVIQLGGGAASCTVTYAHPYAAGSSVQVFLQIANGTLNSTLQQNSDPLNVTSFTIHGSGTLASQVISYYVVASK